MIKRVKFVSIPVSDEDRELDTLIPDSANQPYDIHRVIEAVVENLDIKRSLFERVEQP